MRDIDASPDNQVMAAALITVARQLEMFAVAEGVETKEQEGTLHRLGCAWVQGYYYAMPMDGEEFYQRYCTEAVQPD